jgi:hypothetical protein
MVTPNSLIILATGIYLTRCGADRDGLSRSTAAIYATAGSIARHQLHESAGWWLGRTVEFQ